MTSSPTPARSRTGTAVKVTRRTVAAALVVAGATVALAAQPQACRGQLAGADVVRVCEPLPVTDLRVVAVVLLVVALLLPDLSELEVAGVVKLKRDMARAQTEVAQTRAELAALQASYAASSASAGAAASSSPVVNVYPPAFRAELGRVAQATAPGAVDEPVTGPPGWDPISAALATQAAMVGMVELLPAWAGDPVVVGFVPAGPGDPAVPYEAVLGVPDDADDERQAAWAALVNDAPDAVSVEVTPAQIRVGAPARDSDGRTVGALVVDVSVPSPSQEQIGELSALAEAFAAAYAGIVVRLLGESESADGGDEVPRG